MISANDLKVKGVKAIKEELEHAKEVAISIRGKVTYIAMTVEQYDLLRTAEIKAAYNDSMLDIKNGDYVEETADEHIARLWPD